MGEAIIKGVLTKGIAKPENIVVSDAIQERREFLNKQHGVKIVADNHEAVEDADIVVIAVKPQDLPKVLDGLKGLLTKQLVLSIVAGATLDTLRGGLAHDYIVRTMPNMPAQVGEGMTVWTATSEVSEQQKKIARSILTALGDELYVSNEKYIDMATAVSGSGPSYVFLVIEALTDAGVHIGLPRDMAEKMVIQTVLGSAHSVKVSGKHPAELKNKVTSPGGTTAEGLLQLEAGGLRSLLLRAVIAAYEKSKSLGAK